MSNTHANLQLEALRRRLMRIASEGFFEDCLLSLSEESRKLIVYGFRDGKDPYGQRWKPLKDSFLHAKSVKDINKSRQPLRRTGRLQNAMVPRPAGHSIRIDAPVAYAAAHQNGTKFIPRRQFLPTTDQGLGISWSRAFKGALTSAMHRGMR